MTDFTRVMLTDKLAWQLFGQAGKEGLLYRTEGSDDAPKRGRGPIAQHALAFLVLLYPFGQPRPDRAWAAGVQRLSDEQLSERKRGERDGEGSLRAAA